MFSFGSKFKSTLYDDVVIVKDNIKYMIDEVEINDNNKVNYIDGVRVEGKECDYDEVVSVIESIMEKEN